MSSKLNHLHVLFLLRLALVGRLPEPDPRLIAISVTMLRLVVEAIMLKDHLANSGTSLVWKVSYLAMKGKTTLNPLKPP